MANSFGSNGFGINKSGESETVVAGTGRCNALNSNAKIRGAFLVVVLFIAGCINTPLPDYYVLTPERGEVGASQFVNIANLAVGVGPITIPETVNRPNIVTPQDSNKLEVAEYHRWSEPLRENISRIVITNLADRLGINKLYAYPWLRTELNNIARIDVLQMTGSLGKDVYLQVRWQILTGTKPYELLDTRITEYRIPVIGVGYSSLVAAYSRAYSALSDDIARALAEINGAVSDI